MDRTDLRHIATFCGSCNCGCPEVHIDDVRAGVLAATG